MNFKKVENYINKRIEEYKPYYPKEIFEGFNFEVQGGSFGRCFISINSPYYSTSCRYVGNYNAINKLISYCVVNAYENLTSRFYESYKKENEIEASYKLEIYNDDKLVNTMQSNNIFKVKNELLKCFFAKEKRGVKTRIHFVPYSKKINITHIWNKEDYGGSHKLTYKYYFEGIDL